MNPEDGIDRLSRNVSKKFGFLNPEDGTDRLSRDGKKFGLLNPEDETDRLSRNVDKKFGFLNPEDGTHKADSHIACRAHAAPMPFPCHAVLLRA